MMRLLIAFAYVTLSIAVARPAFLSPCKVVPRVGLGAIRTEMSAAAHAQEHLQELHDEFDRLKVQLKQLQEEPNMRTGREFLQSCLKTALDYTHTMEQVEEEQAATAHQALEKALEEEKVLERQAVIDAAVAEHHSGPDHFIAQSYAEERIHVARVKEEEAYDEEQRHLDCLEQLQHNEAELKATLDQLKEENRKDEFLRAV